MNKRAFLLTFTGLLLGLLPTLTPDSLHAAPSLVGRWQNVKELESYPGSYDALVFNADGTFLYDGPGPHSCQYTVKGNLIVLSDCGAGCESMPGYTLKIIQLDAQNLVLQRIGEAGPPGRYKRVANPESPDQPPPPSTNGYSVQDHVQVLWQGSWYPAVILKIEGNKYLIHYDGYDSSWDEWVTTDRMKRQNDE